MCSSTGSLATGVVECRELWHMIINAESASDICTALNVYFMRLFSIPRPSSPSLKFSLPPSWGPLVVLSWGQLVAGFRGWLWPMGCQGALWRCRLQCWLVGPTLPYLPSQTASPLRPTLGTSFRTRLGLYIATAAIYCISCKNRPLCRIETR